MDGIGKADWKHQNRIQNKLPVLPISPYKKIRLMSGSIAEPDLRGH